MSDSIDSKVVEARFDNKQFQEGVKGTLNSLDQLKRGLNLEGATNGLDNISQGANRVTGRINAMRIATVVAIATIAHQAVIAGEQLVKSFTIDPIMAGFHNYETQINAVQTILANTGLKGAKGMAAVNGVLAELNTYANQTVYNFSEMAKNIGTFTAAGVDLKVSAESIKGIANLAAVSGSNSDQASTAMYQLSQAIAANQVKLQDWNSVVNAGLGGKLFQQALFNTGMALHTIKGVKMGESFEQWTKAGNTFRGSLQKGWITGKVLTQTLQGFTGDLTAAQLKAMGYNKEQIKQIQDMGKTAVDAATKIKTITQLKDALKEEVATAYGAIFKTIFGDINQAKTVFSSLHVTLENALTNPIYALNRMLVSWTKLGGRVLLLDTIKDGVKEIGAFLKPIKDAFKEIFPATTARNLYSMTVSLHNFVESLKISKTHADELKHTFAGVFAVFDIGWQIIKQTAHFIADLFGSVTKGSGGFLKTTSSIGDFLVALDQAVKKGDGLKKFFGGLEHVLKPPIHLLNELVGVLTHLFSFKAPSTKQISGAFEPLGTLGHFLIVVWDKFLGLLANVGHILGPVAAHVSAFLRELIGGFSFDDILHGMDTALLTGFVLLFKRLVDHFTHKESPLKGLVDTIKEPFEKLTGVLGQMQKTLRAATLVEIATAVALLTASAVALSTVDSAKLTKALTAMAVEFGQLFGSLVVFEKIGGAKGLSTTAAGLVIFATALRILTASVKALSSLSWTELAKGLTGVTVLLAGLTLASAGMAGKAAGMVRTGAGLVLLAAGIRILADAVKELSGLSWNELEKGLIGVGTLLATLALFTQLVAANKAGIVQGAGLVLLAASIKILASAVGDFAKMQWEEIGKGLAAIAGILLAVGLFSQGVGNPITLVASGAALIAIGIAMNILARAMADFGKMNWENIGKSLVVMGGALGIVVLALNAMPVTSVLSSAALIGVSIALLAIGQALKSMGGMSWEEIAKGLVTLAGALTIIAVAMDAMLTALPGAAALLVVTAALALLVPELKILGDMSWGDILRGLVALAGAFAVIGVAGALMTPVIPTLLGLGASIALLGVGVAAIGAGVFLFSMGLTALATSGAAAAAAIATIFTTVLGLLPTLAKALGETLIQLAKAIAIAAPQLLKTAIILLDMLLVAIAKEGPKIIETFGNLLVHLMAKLAQSVPKMATSALVMVLGILKAIESKEPAIIAAMVNLIVGMLDGLARGMPRMVAAGANLMVKFLNGIASQLTKVIDAGTNIIISFIKGIAQSALKIANAAMDTVIYFINGLADAIEKHTPELRKAGEHLAFAVVDGMTLGLAGKAKDVVKTGVGVAKDLIGGIGGALGIHSPSTEFIKVGKYVMQGFAIGLMGNRDQVMQAWGTANDLLKAAISSSADDIKKYSDKLATLESAHKKNKKAILETALALAQARRENLLATNALDDLDKKHAHALVTLKKLGAQYESYAAQIDAANQKVKDAVQLRNDYNSQVKDQLNTLPDITDTTQLGDYVNQLEYQVNDTQKFAEVLAELKKKGLDDAVYKELVDKGPVTLQFAEQLLAGGEDAIKNVDALSEKLAKEAGTLASNASKALYQAGVDAAQGLLNGLKAKQKAIENEMAAIAKALVAALKKELQIKSPSKVMGEIGGFTIRGLAESLTKGASVIEKASAGVGRRAVDAMRKSLSSMSDLMSSQMDTNPTIAPVVDLSEVRRGMAELGNVLSDQQLSVDATYSTAKDAASGYQENRAAALALAAEPTPVPVPGDVTFVQYNSSPKALSTAEIYRNTKNQISTAKGALTSDAA